MRRESSPQRVHNPLESILRSIDRGGRGALFDVWRLWADSVGAAISRRTEITGLRNGVLFVTVDGSTWMQELQTMKERLRLEINEKLGRDVIEDIYFSAGLVERVIEAPVQTRRADAEAAVAGSRSVQLPALPGEGLTRAFEDVLAARDRRAASLQKRPRRKP